MRCWLPTRWRRTRARDNSSATGIGTLWLRWSRNRLSASGLAGVDGIGKLARSNGIGVPAPRQSGSRAAQRRFTIVQRGAGHTRARVTATPPSARGFTVNEGYDTDTAAHGG